MKIFVGGFIPRQQRTIEQSFAGESLTFACCEESEVRWGRLAASCDVAVCNIKFMNHKHEAMTQRCAKRYIRYKGGASGVITLLRELLDGKLINSH